MKRNTPRVLWLDNDPGYIYGFVMALKRAGSEVTVVTTVTAAEEALQRGRYDVFLLDVMIPVKNDEAERGYDRLTTDDSFKTGLAFFRKHRAALEGQTTVFALTVRVDKAIRDEFVAAGLPPENFLTKLEVRDASTFIARVLH